MDIFDDFTKEDRAAYHEQVKEHYGETNGWNTDHLQHCDFLIHLMCSEAERGAKSYVAEWGEDYRHAYAFTAVYTKDAQVLATEALKLLGLVGKMEHVEGLELDEKLFIAKKLRDDGESLAFQSAALLQKGEYLRDKVEGVEQYEIDNPSAFYKKSVGRPSSKFLYQWMDYLVLMLGTNQKAADYASDSPIIDSKNTGTLLREHRKYRNAQGQG